METLGWLIWAFSCVLLLYGLTALHQKKRRGRRIFFCIRIAAGLALSYFTSFSKFHLLWIVPLPTLLVVLGMGSLIGGSLAWHKFTARKPKSTTLPAGSFPPFGTLQWSDEAWEGEVSLPAWAGFQSRGGAYCSEDSEKPSDGRLKVTVKPEEKGPLEPSEAQCLAVKFQIEHGQEVVDAVLAALLPHYLKFRKEGNSEEMPLVSDASEFRKMIGIGNVYVLPHASEEHAYIGFEFGCDWEAEHGLGIVVHRDRVIEIGEGEIAFSWSPTVEDDSQCKSAGALTKCQ